MTNQEAHEIADLLNRRNQLMGEHTEHSILHDANDYLVTSVDGRVVGAVQVKSVQWYQAELCHLTVDENHGRQGHGRDLAARAEARARQLGARVIQCTIRKGNAGSEGLFRSVGYRRVSTFYNTGSGNYVAVWQKILEPGPKGNGAISRWLACYRSLTSRWKSLFA